MCALYQSKKDNDTLDGDFQTQYDGHQKRKCEAREENAKDKLKAKESVTHHVETFDLQAVLTTPCSLVGELYY